MYSVVVVVVVGTRWRVWPETISSQQHKTFRFRTLLAFRDCYCTSFVDMLDCEALYNAAEARVSPNFASKRN